jgi:putative RNA 2'-phosphotransferase
MNPGVLNLEKLSRVLSLVLRHAPEMIGIRPDRAGWVDIEDLVERLNRRPPGAPKRLRTLSEVDRAGLMAAIAQDAKARYEVSADGSQVRAAQGHSISVDLGYPVTSPPELLYHGTHADALAEIRATGLKAGARHDVHLSQESATARQVGARRGRAVVLTVLAGQMARAGFEFRLSSNGVWLIEAVPAAYLRES